MRSPPQAFSLDPSCSPRASIQTQQSPFPGGGPCKSRVSQGGLTREGLSAACRDCLSSRQLASMSVTKLHTRNTPPGAFGIRAPTQA